MRDQHLWFKIWYDFLQHQQTKTVFQRIWSFTLNCQLNLIMCKTPPLSGKKKERKEGKKEETKVKNTWLTFNIIESTFQRTVFFFFDFVCFLLLCFVLKTRKLPVLNFIIYFNTNVKHWGSTRKKNGRLHTEV